MRIEATKSLNSYRITDGKHLVGYINLSDGCTAIEQNSLFRLIAAAPDLLEFAQFIYDYFKNVHGSVPNVFREKARNAIAKATGE